MSICPICNNPFCHGDPQTDCGSADRKLVFPILRDNKTVGKILLEEDEASTVAAMAEEGVTMLQISSVIRKEKNQTATLLYFDLITPPAEDFNIGCCAVRVPLHTERDGVRHYWCDDCYNLYSVQANGKISVNIEDYFELLGVAWPWDNSCRKVEERGISLRQKVNPKWFIKSLGKDKVCTGCWAIHCLHPNAKVIACYHCLVKNELMEPVKGHGFNCQA